MNVGFEQAKVENKDALVELMRQFNAFDGLPFDRTKARAALGEILRDESLGRVFLIKEGEDLIGYAVLTLGFSLEFHGRDAFIDEIYLSEAFRGKGYGGRALEFLEEQCRELGVKALHLEVEGKNERAQRFYRESGFARQDSFLMTKRIEQNN